MFHSIIINCQPVDLVVVEDKKKEGKKWTFAPVKFAAEDSKMTSPLGTSPDTMHNQYNP